VSIHHCKNPKLPTRKSQALLRRSEKRRLWYAIDVSGLLDALEAQVPQTLSNALDSKTRLGTSLIMANILRILVASTDSDSDGLCEYLVGYEFHTKRGYAFGSLDDYSTRSRTCRSVNRGNSITPLSKANCSRLTMAMKNSQLSVASHTVTNLVVTKSNRLSGIESENLKSDYQPLAIIAKTVRSGNGFWRNSLHVASRF
jgi:hypothetical protein